MYIYIYMLHIDLRPGQAVKNKKCISANNRCIRSNVSGDQG